MIIVSTEQSEIFVLLEKIFKKGIIKEWLYIIAYGRTVVFGEYGIMNTIEMNGITYLNSGTAGNKDFTTEMWREMLKHIKRNDKMVIQYKGSIKFSNICKRYGFRYNSANNSFERGLI